MKRYLIPLAALAAGLTLTACEDYIPPPAGTPAETPVATQLELRDGMRQLWTEHVLWTRVFIISAVAGLPDTQAATDRLLQNQVDIGDAIKPYYGGDAGNQLTVLLHEHIVQAATLVGAAKANDTAKVEATRTAWFDNADRIAKFLSDANPNWAFADVQQMMHEHLNLTLAEATAQLTGNWDADVKAYDAVQNEILDMADVLTEGITAQFPAKVSVPSTTPIVNALHIAMRKLWQDHVEWTRVFIIDDVSNLPGTSAATARLLQNQVDLGEAIKPYYGGAAGNQLAALLREHILGAAKVLDAAEAGDLNALATAKAEWEANADQISAFLASANPYLPRDALMTMMRQHLDQTLAEAAARLKGDYVGEVQAYDVVEQHILHLSDTLSAAISTQFPNGPPANAATP